MKNIFTPQNYLMGLAVALVIFSIYIIFELNWIILPWSIGMLIGCSIVGHYMNKLLAYIDEYIESKKVD